MVVSSIVGDGADTRVTLGALLEIGLAITNIATALVLYPIVRLQSDTLGLGYVASRIVESTIIVVGLISLLSVVTLRDDLAGTGADAGTLTTVGRSLVAIHDWTFLLGPGFCVGGERDRPRLPDVPVRPRAAKARVVRSRRRPAGLRRVDRRGDSGPRRSWTTPATPGSTSRR